MLKYADKLISISYYLLFFLVPLIFFHKTSELFEFNKMVLTYALTTLIVGAWAIKSILIKKPVFRRTVLDIPLVLLLLSQLLSTFTSIDARTSLLGFYSRFHGGLLSTLSYALLYWAYVANIDSKTTIKILRLILISAAVSSVWAIFEHFGHSFSCLLIPPNRSFDVSCWVQDVQNRVYATLGQPNWLASWLTTLIPVTWAMAINSASKKNIFQKLSVPYFWIYVLLSVVYFSALLFTKSRSGIFAIVIAAIIFWIAYLFTNFRKRINITGVLIPLAIINFSLIILTAGIGTPWTPNLKAILNQHSRDAAISTDIENTKPQGMALEVGGTESGKIRKIVWRGAYDIWKAYPILGTGVETFAYSYYNFRPVEHNLVSEWDFLYNKAHNEYLNYLSTTGLLGISVYLVFIVFCLVQISKINLGHYKKTPVKTKNNLNIESINKSESVSTRYLHLALFAGYISILITNFFGFSVVPVALQFFLYPAIALTLERENKSSDGYKSQNSINNVQITGILIISAFTLLFLYSISRYWYADYLYAQGKSFNDEGYPINAHKMLSKAVKLSKNEAVYWDELAKADSRIATAFLNESNAETARQMAEAAFAESERAVNLSPVNVNLLRNQASIFLSLTEIDQKYLINAKTSLKKAVVLAPTEAKIHFHSALAHLRTNEPEEGLILLEKTVQMKPNYLDARYALALTYVDFGEKEKAREQLNYILKYSPNDEKIKEELRNLE